MAVSPTRVCRNRHSSIRHKGYFDDSDSHPRCDAKLLRDGWGFNMWDTVHTPHRWITLTYPTKTEADTARQKIEEATAGVIKAIIAT
jgi:hypothetical protein